MNNFLNKLETGLIVINSCIALSNIETILSIVILGIQVLLVLYKLGTKIYNRIKNKEFNELVEDTQESIDELNDLLDNIKKDGDTNDGTH